jgi:hypothetical protein
VAYWAEKTAEIKKARSGGEPAKLSKTTVRLVNPAAARREELDTALRERVNSYRADLRDAVAEGTPIRSLSRQRKAVRSLLSALQTASEMESDLDAIDALLKADEDSGGGETE